MKARKNLSVHRADVRHRRRGARTGRPPAGRRRWRAPRPGRTAGRQGGQFPRGGRTGPRDSMPQPTGTGVLRGRVVGGDSGGPLRHAVVRALRHRHARGQDGRHRRTGQVGDPRSARRPLQPERVEGRLRRARLRTAPAVRTGAPASNSPTPRCSRTSTSTCRRAASSQAASTMSSAIRSPKRWSPRCAIATSTGSAGWCRLAASRRPTTAGISGSTGCLQATTT